MKADEILGQVLLSWHNLAFFPDSDRLTFGAATGMVETTTPM